MQYARYEYKGLRLKDTAIEISQKNAWPICNPCDGLTKPPQDSIWIVPSDSLPSTVYVTRQDPQNHKLSWANGVESGLHCHSVLFYPENLVYNRRIPCVTLSCRTSPQTYRAVNLAMPPDNGFKHVELIIGDFPTLTKIDASKLLMVKSSESLYLGAVCTFQNVTGLLMHKVFAGDVRLLQHILDMHTSLQVHPFVPRTFILQLSKTPFLRKSVVGMFVGEAAGDWNLGGVCRMMTMDEMESPTMAYYVVQCLLRAQILSLRVLGFTMKCIQPARIWRWHTGFRVYFIGCLADTTYEWQEEDPAWKGEEGLATICITMQQLGLLDYLPNEVRETLRLAHATVFSAEERPRGRRQSCPANTRSANTQSNPDDGHVLYNVYNLCRFTDQETSVENNLETILGSDQYQDFQMLSEGSILEPYIQTHNQSFKWNKAVIVEPDLKTVPALAKVLHIFKGKTNAAAVGSMLQPYGPFCIQPYKQFPWQLYGSFGAQPHHKFSCQHYGPFCVQPNNLSSWNIALDNPIPGDLVRQNPDVAPAILFDSNLQHQGIRQCQNPAAPATGIGSHQQHQQHQRHLHQQRSPTMKVG